MHAEGELAAYRHGLRMPLLVDGMDDAFGRTYAAWPLRFYVVEADGAQIPRFRALTFSLPPLSFSVGWRSTAEGPVRFVAPMYAPMRFHSFPLTQDGPTANRVPPT